MATGSSIAHVAVVRYNADGTLDDGGPNDTTPDDSFGGPQTTGSVSISDISQAEGSSGMTPFNFTVTRSGNLAEAASVSYVTLNGTATAPSDYAALPLTLLTFAPGENVKTITVNVNGDKVKEPNETFQVRLSDPVGATIADDTGLGTIVNDDGKGGTASLVSAPLIDASLKAAAPEDYDLLAAAATYEQAQPGVSALDQFFSDLGSTRRNAKRDGLTISLDDILFQFPL